jgi:hypothetical protein
MTRVVDESNSPSFEDAAVMKFFASSTHNLLAILYSIVHATQFLESLKQLADVSFDGKKRRFPDAPPKASCV